jgi:hypothetical protein
MLARAYDELPEKELHTLRVDELTEGLDITTRNTAHLKEVLRGLVSTSVEWNLLGKDGKEKWGVAPLLAFVELEDGVITYGFGPLRRRLHNPAIYVKIKLAAQNRFRSKHALALYELCVDYLGVGQTPWIAVGKLRALMGVAADEYSTWKDFRRWVLKKGIAEVNTLSDLDLAPEYQREGRGVVAIKMRIRPKPESNAQTLAQAVRSGPIAAELAASIAGDEDPFDLWLEGLSAEERKEVRARAEEQVTRVQPDAFGMVREALVIEVMRGKWRSA